MRTTPRGLGRRVAAAVGALALGLAGLGATTAAQAADLGNIDTGRTGSILIHKH